MRVYAFSLVGFTACSTDFRIDQAEYDRRLCARDAAACDAGPDANGAAGAGGIGLGGMAGSIGAGGSSAGGTLGQGGMTGLAGAGGSLPCSVGQTRCSGNVAETCQGGVWTSTVCAGAAPECEGGACVVCVNGRSRCGAAGPELCVAHAWQSQAPCGAGTICQDGACSIPPSCAGLAASCGSPAGSCCAGPLVEGGDFFRNNSGQYPATVTSFLLDKYEVTVGRFRKFVAAYPGNRLAEGAGVHPRVAGSSWSAAWDAGMPVTQSLLIADVKTCGSYGTWTDAPGAGENLPMHCVDWYTAFNFCVWDGGRLPTDLEWNYAAAGGALQRIYPWGDTEPGFDATYAAFSCYWDQGVCAGSCCLESIAPVGSIPAGNGLWGHADLGGNLIEWMLDVSGGYPTTCKDCASLQNSGLRVRRGGMFSSQADSLRTSLSEPSSADTGGGFRCARNP